MERKTKPRNQIMETHRQATDLQKGVRKVTDAVGSASSSERAEALRLAVEPAWYVMRATYQRELSTQEALRRLGVECFVPMRTVRRRNARGQYARVREVAMHNYLFLHSDRATIDEIKRYRLPQLRYVMHVQDDKRQAMRVPDQAMAHFMAVAAQSEEGILYLEPSLPELVAGDHVRILDGPFKGVEGLFLRLKRGRDRRVVVKLNNLIAIATAELPASAVEKIES